MKASSAILLTLLLLLSLVTAVPMMAVSAQLQQQPPPTIVSLNFSPDGTGWLTVDYNNNGTLSPVTEFTHTLTEENGYMWYNGYPFFTSNRTQVNLNSIDFSSQIILDPTKSNNRTLPAKPNFSPTVIERYSEQGVLAPATTASGIETGATAAPAPEETTTTRTLPSPDWDPLQPGPIPIPPPTSDPDLIRFNELFQQCKAGQDKIASLQGNSYDHNNQDRCIFAMKDAIATFCDDFQTFDATKCSYVNRPDVILFLEINDRIFGFGDTPPTLGGGLLLP